MKEKIYRLLKQDKNNTNIQIEHRIKNQIADVYCEHHNLKYVIECQCTHISKTDYDFRNDGWKQKDVYYMWVFGSKFIEITPTKEVFMVKTKKRLIKRWNNINCYHNGMFMTISNKNGICIYKKPLIKPYLSIVRQNKILIFKELIPK